MLLSPKNCHILKKAARMDTVNKEIVETSKTPEKITSHHGVKHKRTNNHYSPETQAKIATYMPQKMEIQEQQNISVVY